MGFTSNAPTDFDFDFNLLEKANVSPIAQRTPEWYAARRGRFTGSEVWKLITEPRSKADKDVGNLSETAKTYINQVLAEATTCVTPQFYTPATQWGIDNEADARDAYTLYHSKEIIPADFVPHGDFGGGSSDGWIGSDGIAEIKCPYNSGGHIENLLLEASNVTPLAFKESHKEYYWQMQNNLMVTGREYCEFISYDPRFAGKSRLAKITMYRVEDDIKLIQQKILLASVIMLEIKAKLGL